MSYPDLIAIFQPISACQPPILEEAIKALAATTNRLFE
jgi:hypothetical protein